MTTPSVIQTTIPIMKIDEHAAWQAILEAAWRDDKEQSGESEVEAAVRAGARIEPEAADMLECLMPLARWRGPLVIGQLGQSLDGRICTESGDSRYVNGKAALVHLHRLRALVDCVLVGVGTVVADHPRLTTRGVRGPDPVRAVLDPRGRAPADASPLAAQADAPPTLHLVGSSALARLTAPAAHVQRVSLKDSDAGVAPGDVLAALASAGCRRILVEGGANTISRFVAAGALDRLHLLVAPLLIGSGRAGLSLPPVERLCDAARPPTRSYPLGEDTLFDLSL